MRTRRPPGIGGPAAWTLAWTAAASALLLAGSQWVFAESGALYRQQGVLLDARVQLARLQVQIDAARQARRSFVWEPAAATPALLDQVGSSLTRAAELLPRLDEALQSLGQTEGAAPLRSALDVERGDLTEAVALAGSGQAARARQLLRERESRLGAAGVRLRMARLDADLQEASARFDARHEDMLIRQRIGATTLIGLNLLMLSVLAMRTMRQFMRQERRRRSLKRRTERLQATVQGRTAELSALATHLQTQCEAERARLARDLHDELGALLTTAKLDLAGICQRSPDRDHETAHRLRSLSGGLDQIADMTRRVIENLRPSLLDNLGLVPALVWHVQQTCNRAGLDCRLNLPDGLPALDGETALALFRVVQEALNNAVRHARASLIHVELSATAEGLRLVVEDDGVGLGEGPGEGAGEVAGGGHGLTGMRHRVRSLGGELNLVSPPGRGTRVEAWVPRSQPAPAQAVPVEERTQPMWRPASVDQGVADGVAGQFGIAAQAHLVQQA